MLNRTEQDKTRQEKKTSEHISSDTTYRIVSVVGRRASGPTYLARLTWCHRATRTTTHTWEHLSRRMVSQSTLFPFLRTNHWQYFSNLKPMEIVLDVIPNKKDRTKTIAKKNMGVDECGQDGVKYFHYTLPPLFLSISLYFFIYFFCLTFVHIWPIALTFTMCGVYCT